MKTSIISTALSQNILSAVTPDHVDAWIDQVSAAIGGASWRHVGWTSDNPDPCNAGQCEVANDKRAPIAEIVFNCIDAVIELAHSLSPFEAASPKQAVEACPLFGSDSWMFDRVSATLRDSGTEERPTLDIRDLGHGQHPDDFSKTLLSLNRSTKISVPYLCGKFGMGMKSAFKFCDRTVIVSRPHPSMLDGRADEVGVTVVRKRFADREKAARYEYLCDGNGQIIRLHLPSFDCGTLVRLTRYDMEGYHGGLGQLNKSLYLMLNSYVIEPPVGISLHDRREASRENKKFRGLVHALSKPKTPNSHEDSFVAKVEFDGVESQCLVRYYVLHAKESVRDKSGTKVKAEQGITFSHNGQRHGVEPRSIFKSRFGLGIIRERLAVVIDTSGLSPAACSDLYSSNRIGVTVGSKVYDSIMDALQSHIERDEDLALLDAEATRSKSEERSAQTENLEKAVSAFVVDILGKKNVVFAGRKVGVSGGGGNKGRRNRSDAHLPSVPTRVLIDNDPLTAPQGRFAYLTIDIDAKNGYVKPGDGKVTVSFKNRGVARVSSEGELIGGKMRLTVTVPGSSPKGESEFKVCVRDAANGVDISAVGTIKVVEPRKGGEGDGNKTSGGGGEVMEGPHTSVAWLYRNEWAAAGEHWNAEYPGDCVVNRKEGVVRSVTFTLNADFAPIEAIRTRVAKSKINAFDRRRNRYAEALCKALLHKELNKMGSDASFAAAIADLAFGGILGDDDDADGDDASSKRVSIPTPKRGVLESPTLLAETRAINP